MGPSFTGPIHEITADISKFRLRLSTLARSHPLRPFLAYLLALQLFERYSLLNQKDDIDKTILYLTESLLLSPLSWLAHGLMIVEALFSLSHSLLERSNLSEEPEDAIYAAIYFRYLRDLAQIPFATFQRQRVTALLVKTLAMQIALEASDVVHTLKEMTTLTRELLTSDPSSDHTTLASACFARAVVGRLPELSQNGLLNEIIECLRLARTHKPELREVPFFLAKCLFIRYEDADLDEAVSILDEMIASSSPGDEFLAECQELVPRLAIFRTLPENSEEAIYRAHTFLSSSSVEDPLYPTWSYVLDHAAKIRFKNFSQFDGLEASSSSDPFDPQLIPIPSKIWGQVPADIIQKMRPFDLAFLLHPIRVICMRRKYSATSSLKHPSAQRTSITLTS